MVRSKVDIGQGPKNHQLTTASPIDLLAVDLDLDLWQTVTLHMDHDGVDEIIGDAVTQILHDSCLFVCLCAFLTSWFASAYVLTLNPPSG